MSIGLNLTLKIIIISKRSGANYVLSFPAIYQPDRFAFSIFRLYNI
jgi:hypothetical protein